MKLSRLLLVCAIVSAAMFSAAAQNDASTITALEIQTPKNGMVQQYEAGRKTKAAWHRQQKDPQMLWVLEILSGEHTGSYIVGRSDLHWADMDKPPIPDASDVEEYNKAVGAYVEKFTASYYEIMPRISNPGPDSDVKYISVTSFHVKYGRNDDFRSAIARIHDAAEKTKWGEHYRWQHLVNGGPGGTYVLLIDHPNWASFGDDPSIKPMRDMLREAFGEQEAMSVIERLNASIDSSYSEIAQFRPDLSYIPQK